MIYLFLGDKYILQDLLSVHMVRHVESNTIISYHPKLRRTTAKQLYSLINRTGNSVYWSKIFEKSKDPTCLFLCFLWYAMYEWDEVFEILYSHINQLVSIALLRDTVRYSHCSYRNNWFSTAKISNRRDTCTFCKHIYSTIGTFSKTSGSPFSL